MNITVNRAVIEQALEALEATKWDGSPSFVKSAITVLRTALEQPEQQPVAWLQFKDNEPPVVAPRNLGTSVFLGGIRGGLAHDAGEKK